MSGRACRSKSKERPEEVGPRAEPEMIDYRVAVPDDAPSLDAPLEEQQAWLAQQFGPGLIPDEALEEIRERNCALPGCTTKATRGSLFCAYHQKTALGEAGARELRQLNREMERLARITDREEQKLAVAKFRARVEGGSFSILFSRKTRETLEQAADDIVLDLELGALRVALARAIEEIEDPKELSLAIARLANSAVRASRANVEMRKARRLGW